MGRGVSRGFPRWGRARRTRRPRGVAHVLAMILMVAAVVILAAVLYVVLGGLTHGPAAPPIGSAFAVGTPTAGTCWTGGVTNHICGTSGDRLWNFTVQFSTVTLGDVLIEVHSPNGQIYHNTLPAAFSIVRAGSSTPVAYYSIAAGQGLAMSSGFTYAAGYSSATKIDYTMSLVIGTGTQAMNWVTGQGNYLTILGTGHYSGATAPATLP